MQAIKLAVQFNLLFSEKSEDQKRKLIEAMWLVSTPHVLCCVVFCCLVLSVERLQNQLTPCHARAYGITGCADAQKPLALISSCTDGSMLLRLRSTRALTSSRKARTATTFTS
jgi:hypothetical protein